MNIIYIRSFPIHLKIHQEFMELYKLYLRTCLSYAIKIRAIFLVILKKWSFWNELSVWSDLLLPSTPVTPRLFSIQFNISDNGGIQRIETWGSNVMWSASHTTAEHPALVLQTCHFTPFSCLAGGIRWESLGLNTLLNKPWSFPVSQKLFIIKMIQW